MRKGTWQRGGNSNLNEHHIQSKWAAHDDSIDQKNPNHQNLEFEKSPVGNHTGPHKMELRKPASNDNGGATSTAHHVTTSHWHDAAAAAAERSALLTTLLLLLPFSSSDLYIYSGPHSRRFFGLHESHFSHSSHFRIFCAQHLDTFGDDACLFGSGEMIAMGLCITRAGLFKAL
jgi:hypothetical protein